MRIRPAGPSDLAACQALWEATATPPDVSGAGPARTAADRPAPNPLYAHELATGTLVVAIGDDGTVVGFGAALDRPGRWYLADLFVEPAHQGQGVGRALLDHLTVAAPDRRITLASEDRRSQVLYARAGMRPRCPVYRLRGPLHTALPTTHLRAQPMGAGDGSVPDGLAQLDQELTGVDRPEDLAYWCGPDRSTPLGLSDQAGSRQGYAVVRPDCPWALDAEDRRAATVVTVAVRRSAWAIDGVLAALAWAAAAGCATARLLVPGPHPALRPLLDASFRIVDTDVLCASTDGLFDPTRLIPSATVL